MFSLKTLSFQIRPFIYFCTTYFVTHHSLLFTLLTFIYSYNKHKRRWNSRTKIQDSSFYASSFEARTCPDAYSSLKVPFFICKNYNLSFSTLSVDFQAERKIKLLSWMRSWIKREIWNCGCSLCNFFYPNVNLYNALVNLKV